MTLKSLKIYLQRATEILIKLQLSVHETNLLLIYVNGLSGRVFAQINKEAYQMKKTWFSLELKLKKLVHEKTYKYQILFFCCVLLLF